MESLGFGTFEANPKDMELSNTVQYDRKGGFGMKQKWELTDQPQDQPVNGGSEVKDISIPKGSCGAGLWNTPESDMPNLVEALHARGYDLMVTPNTIRVFGSDFETLWREIDSLALQLDQELGTDIYRSIPEIWALRECCLKAGKAECETGHLCPTCQQPSLGDPALGN
jgi:hypothetical protein